MFLRVFASWWYLFPRSLQNVGQYVGKYAFDKYCATMRCVLKKEPLIAMAERITSA